MHDQDTFKQERDERGGDSPPKDVDLDAEAKGEAKSSGKSAEQQDQGRVGGEHPIQVISLEEEIDL